VANNEGIYRCLCSRNKIIGKDKRTGHYVKITKSEKDGTDIENYNDFAANRLKEKVTVQKEAN
jgi:hypothetical protein